MGVQLNRQPLAVLIFFVAELEEYRIVEIGEVRTTLEFQFKN